MLSHSTWRDEKSVVRWQTKAEHHIVHGKGRFKIFWDYHLRVGDVTSDTHPPKEAPVHERRFDETEVGKGTLAAFTEIMPSERASFANQADLLPAHFGLDVRSGSHRTRCLGGHLQSRQDELLVSWKDPNAAESWVPKNIDGVESLRHRKVRFIRDYGRFDRREIPQFYPDIEGRESKDPEPAN